MRKLFIEAVRVRAMGLPDQRIVRARGAGRSRLVAALRSVAGIVALSAGLVGCDAKPPGEAAAGSEPGPSKDAARGPHGGRLLSEGAFQAEVTIYERGVPPQFRVYFYADSKPLPPAEVLLQIEVHRLGGRVDKIGFKPDQDYLVGDQVVEEPHSFDVTVRAERKGTKHIWTYSQTEGRVELSDDAIRASEIGIETAGPATLRGVLELPGEVALNADKAVHILPRVSGIVSAVRKNQGDAVRRGDIIAVIESRGLAEAKREFIDTAHDLEFERKAFEREERLWKRRISSEASYLTQERLFHETGLKHRSARQQLESLGMTDTTLQALLDEPHSALTRYELRAPIDGVIIEKTIATGQAVAADQDLFTIADLSSVWVNVAVYAKDLGAVRVGQKVVVTSQALGDEAQGRISYLGSLVGGESRSAVARIVLQDPARKWRPGLFVTAAVVYEEVKVPVAVKRDGLQKFRDWDVVFVKVGNLFEARPLELGRQDGGWVEVKSGLKAGEKYAAANSFILKADVLKSGASHDH